MVFLGFEKFNFIDQASNLIVIHWPRYLQYVSYQCRSFLDIQLTAYPRCPDPTEAFLSICWALHLVRRSRIREWLNLFRTPDVVVASNARDPKTVNRWDCRKPTEPLYVPVPLGPGCLFHRIHINGFEQSRALPRAFFLVSIRSNAVAKNNVECLVI